SNRLHPDNSTSVAVRIRAIATAREVEAKTVDMTVIRTTPLNTLAAGCEDLIVCTASSHCPLPFADLAEQDRHARLCH
ncbi:MAG: hypothetical protein ACJ72W_03890, partial [Actinoallomurus sp.]